MSIASRWGRVRDAESRGIRKGKLYKLAEKHQGLFRKFDNVTLVDLDLLDTILAELPPAEFGLRSGVRPGKHSRALTATTNAKATR
jgi:hypothetical protein